MKIRSLVAEKLLKQNYLYISIIFKCIFRYIPNLQGFLVHKVYKYKNIHKVRDNYFSKCPNTMDILPPFESHKIDPSPSNVQLLWYRFQMLTLYFIFIFDRQSSYLTCDGNSRNHSSSFIFITAGIPHTS